MTAMTTAGLPHRLVNLADWEQLPVDELHHVECSEGILAVTPKPYPQHQLAAGTLMAVLNAQLPQSLTALPEVDVLLTEEPLTVRAPDIVVTTTDVVTRNPARLGSDDVLLAVEIMSLGSRRTDRVTKFSEYAEAGIPDYWIIDLETPSLTCYQLSEAGTYQPNGEFGSVAEVTTGVGTLTVDLARLTRR